MTATECRCNANDAMMKCKTLLKCEKNPTTEEITYHISGKGKSWSYEYGKLYPGCYNYLLGGSLIFLCQIILILRFWGSLLPCPGGSFRQVAWGASAAFIWSARGTSALTHVIVLLWLVLTITLVWHHWLLTLWIVIDEIEWMSITKCRDFCKRMIQKLSFSFPQKAYQSSFGT